MKLLLLLACLAAPAFAAESLADQPQVKKALAYILANNEKTLASQVTIAEIPAPTFQEGKRATYMASEFRRVGLTNVEIDKQGNVLGWREGEIKDALVLAAHLDISFAPGVNTKVRKDGKRWYGPGLGDDSRGLAALLTIAEAMNDAALHTHQTVLFVANVGEEGLGDLNGVRYLFEASPWKGRLRGFISMDGADPSRIVTGGTGVKRYRVTLSGPGGHSYGNFGRPSAIHAAGRVIDLLSDMDVPAQPRTTFNVGRIEGGTAVNAIAEECSFEIDLRSVDPGALDRVEVKLFEAVRLGVERENKARAASGATMKSQVKLVGNRPAGQTRSDHPLVRAADWALRASGFEPHLDFSSTDANFPISLGIPAITMGAGGREGNAHSLDEWYEPADAWKGPQTVLLTILAFDAGLLS
ncbi:MAG: M20/M25/M40 family metallo-hydrolase [Acidobacteriota bacterium]|nr:M20/M25/M40 family metallo-hydrolase [Acidobacteriota bacterium]